MFWMFYTDSYRNVTWKQIIDMANNRKLTKAR